MSSSIEIRRHRIGYRHPCFVIAGVGVNHNGDVQLAHARGDDLDDPDFGLPPADFYLSEAILQRGGLRSG